MPARKNSVRVSAGVVLAAVCAATLCACGPDSSGSDDATTPPATSASKVPAPAPSTSAADPARGSDSGPVPNGTKLKTALPTAATAPKGWKLDDSSAFDTGATVRPPSSPLLPSDDCSEALTNGGAKTLTSDYEAAYAMTGLTSPTDGSSSVVVNGYEAGDSAKQMAEVTALVKRCASFSAQDIDGKTVKMAATATPVSGLGDEALDVKVTPTGAYVAAETVLVRSGNVIMAVDEDDATGRPAPLVPVARQLARPLPLKS